MLYQVSISSIRVKPIELKVENSQISKIKIEIQSRD